MMELKEYQERVLDAFTKWRNELTTAREQSEQRAANFRAINEDVPADVWNYPKTAWEKLTDTCEVAVRSKSYAERTATAGFPIPHICFKVPTGGGKTLLGAAAVERMNMTSGLVLWMVPTNAIYRQTKEKLWDRQHDYRQMLERGGQVKVLEKDDVFTAADVEHYLCVMLISLQSVNRQNNRDFLRMFKEAGKYMSFFPDNDDALGEGRLRNKHPDLDPPGQGLQATQSLYNVFKMVRPVVVLDEAHKAYGKKGHDDEQYVQSVNQLNPSMVIELTATPSPSRSNMVVVSGKDLHSEEMIKLPVQVTSYTQTDWRHTLGQAHAKLEELQNEAVSLENSEGRYIRPIAVVRVGRTGADQRDTDYVHSEDVREYLTENLGVPAAEVAVQSSTSRELDGVDLLSPLSRVRWIITKAALMEGWDCSFAYLLVMLDNTRAKGAVTQLVGRVLRQHDAKVTKRKALDQCYVYCHTTNVNDAVQYVKDALEQEGMGDLDDEVHASQSTTFQAVTIQRRDKFKDKDFFLPKVLHRKLGGGWEELDYQRHILPSIDLNLIDAPSSLQITQPDQPTERRAEVGLDESGTTETYYDPQALHVDESVKIAWYARRISDIMPNPFQAARVAMEMIQQLRAAGQDDSAIYGQRPWLASQLREHVSNAMEQQAETVFRAKLGKEIRFDLQTSDHNHRIQKSYEIVVAENDKLLQRFGKSMQLSLFEPVFDRDFNDLERKFAFYLEKEKAEKALQWWHRIAVRQSGEYYIRGWKRERIWPDFVAFGGEKAGKASFLVFETKGEHLKDYEDTKYKESVFKALEDAFNGRSLNGGKVTVSDGPAAGVFRLVFDKEGFFPEADKAFEHVAGGYVASTAAGGAQGSGP